MRDEQEHIEESLLNAYADNPASIQEPAVAVHVSECDACAAEVADVRRFTKDLRDDAAWWAVERGADLSSSLRDFASRCDAEDAAAEETLRPIVGAQYRFVRANIIRDQRFYTGGVVRLLCEQARRQCVQEPRFAFLLAEAACAIAEALADDYYPAGAVHGLRGTAWKDYSTACRYLGRLEDGFDALKRAEQAYRKLPDSGISLAVVNLCRAGMFFEQERYSDALRHIRSAAGQFERRQERSRYFEAKEVEAIILHKMGDVETARVSYEEAFALADQIGDPDMKARAARNLGIAYREAGKIDSASKYFLIALQLYEALGAQAMVVHTRWSIAALALAAGKPSDAAERLPAIISDLKALGISRDAARAELDLAEALLILGRFDAVEEVCAQLLEFFSYAGMMRGAMTGAAYLKESAAARSLTRGDIERIRKYFSDLDGGPDLMFAPPLGE